MREGGLGVEDRLLESPAMDATLYKPSFPHLLLVMQIRKIFLFDSCLKVSVFLDIHTEKNVSAPLGSEFHI